MAKRSNVKVEKKKDLAKKKPEKRVKFSLPSSDDDVFEKKGYIGLGDEPSSDDDMFDDEEAVLDLPHTSDDEDNLDDEGIMEERSGEEEEEGWGKQRKNYYDADTRVDLEAETEEAVKLQKKRLAQLQPQDFTLFAPKFKKSEITLSDSESDDTTNELDGAELVEEFKRNTQILKDVLEPFMERAKNLPRSQGLKFLSVKYQLLANYCSLIIRYLQLKLSKSKKDMSGLVDELIRHRLLLEKLKPVENKLKHQIEKLLNAQPESKTLKAAVGSFADDADENSVPESEQEVYKAPKVSAMPYPHEKKRPKEAAADNRFPELQEDYEDVPEEEAFNVAATSTNKHRAISKKVEEQEEYEEDNFVRFSLSRAEKNKLQKATKLNDELDDLEDFMDVMEKKHSSHKKDKKDDTVERTIKKAKKQMMESDESITDYSSSEGEDLIQQARNKKIQQKNKPQRPVQFRPVEDISRDAERPASKSILRNRGLTTSRPKDIKNPRVKQRRKFERAVKRLPSSRPVAAKGGKSSGGYGGEASGIRTNISRSTKF